MAAELPAVASYQRAVAESYDVLGAAQARMGRRDEALRSLARARATLERLIADHPDFIAYQADLAENYLWTGVVYQDSGRTADAARELSNARELLGRMAPGSGSLYALARAEARLVPLAEAGERAPRPTGRWRRCGGPSPGATVPSTTSGPTLASTRCGRAGTSSCSCSTSSSPTSPFAP